MWYNYFMADKQCTKCKTQKEISKFSRLKGGKYGVRSWCKQCSTKYSSAYAKAHPERVNKNNNLYNQRHRDKRLAKLREYRLANIDRMREKDRQYAVTHREEARLKAAKWYLENKERATIAARIYRAKNAEIIKIRKAAYSKSHQIERNMIEHKREAKKKGNGGTYIKQQFIDLCQKYDNKCLMCKRSDVELTVDHVIPIALGGSNYIENIQPLCLSCNSKKHITILDLR